MYVRTFQFVSCRYIKELDGGLLERSQLGLGHSYSRAKVNKSFFYRGVYVYVCSICYYTTVAPGDEIVYSAHSEETPRPRKTRAVGVLELKISKPFTLT